MFDILGVSDALKVVFAVMLEYKVIITSKQYTPLFYCKKKKQPLVFISDHISQCFFLLQSPRL